MKMFDKFRLLFFFAHFFPRALILGLRLMSIDVLLLHGGKTLELQRLKLGEKYFSRIQTCSSLFSVSRAVTCFSTVLAESVTSLRSRSFLRMVSCCSATVVWQLDSRTLTSRFSAYERKKVYILCVWRNTRLYSIFQQNKASDDDAVYDVFN